MEGGPFGDIVLYGDRSTLADESFHTLCVSSECSQVQSSASLLILNIQIDQRLEKYLQSLMMTIIGLELGNVSYKEHNSCLSETFPINCEENPSLSVSAKHNRNHHFLDSS